MKQFISIGAICLLLLACSQKEKLAPPSEHGFPISEDPLPPTLTGTWIRTESLRTFDYKPSEWVNESPDSSSKKRIHFNVGKTYVSNQLPCNGCAVEWKADTLYLKNTTGYYKFPVITLSDTLLHIRTKTDESDYSLPDTGLFDFILEEKYRKIK